MRNESYNQFTPMSFLAPRVSIIDINCFTLQEQAEKQFENDIEMIKYLTHEVNNIKHADGRINMAIDKQGQLSANSVSPYSKKYFDNIEEKIKPLVKALHDKRYLMYSSCEGHGLSFRRYVGLAFGDEDTRQYVANEIMKLKLPGIFVKYIDSVANQKITKTIKGIPQLSGKYTEEERQEEEFKQKEIFTFNIQFHRNYENYYFLEIVILKEINFDIKKPYLFFEQLKLTYLKRYKWDSLTQKIVELVNSPTFKKYPY